MARSTLRRPWRVVAGLLALALLAVTCSDDGGDEAEPDAPADDVASDDTPDPADGDPADDTAESVPASFSTRASAGQVTVTGAEPGTALGLTGPGAPQTGTADELGNLIFRRVEPGEGWQVSDDGADPPAVSDPLIVPGLTDHPDPSFYADQEIGDGYGYIEMRDGTLLAAMVRLPGPIEDGPYPTVIEYSGYDPASPYEDDIEAAQMVYGMLGWATVGVNIRGSGCSGGAFDYFEPLQSIDGYDVVEAIAAQDWVYGNHVGMVGVSYSGISQLFVAQTQPPSLAAITPLSVIEDIYRSVLYPGGIYNNGFAKSWADARQGANEAYGQGWVSDRVEEGDEVCDANQLLRSQNQDLAAMAAQSAFYTAEQGDYLAPRTFVDRITVPTFLAGSWQDEQTGGRFPTMLDDFTGTDVFIAHLYNGAHADSFGPESLHAATELLDVYVAERVPRVDPGVRLAAPLLYQEVFGVAGVQVPPDRFDSLEEARATLESEFVTVFMENGGNPAAPGAPVSRGEATFDSWPPPEAEPRAWVLSRMTGGEGVGEFAFDVDRSQELVKRPEGSDDPADEFDALEWRPLEAGGALVYETEPFAEDLLLLGTGRVALAIQVDEVDADLQVTISEVRPDGQEMYVQSGWLRASHRAIDEAESSDVLPWHPYTAEAAADLPPGEFTVVDVELFPAGHVFRTGSRLRLIVDSPGGNRNLWAFDVLPHDGSVVRIDPQLSSLTLPFVAGVDVPEGLPDCASVRSQPCRPWTAYENAGAN